MNCSLWSFHVFAYALLISGFIPIVAIMTPEEDPEEDPMDETDIDVDDDDITFLSDVVTYDDRLRLRMLDMFVFVAFCEKLHDFMPNWIGTTDHGHTWTLVTDSDPAPEFHLEELLYGQKIHVERSALYDSMDSQSHDAIKQLCHLMIGSFALTVQSLPDSGSVPRRLTFRIKDPYTKASDPNAAIVYVVTLIVAPIVE